MGSLISRYWASVAQAYPPKASWTVDGIPDLSGKVAVVTGGNSGCGYETWRSRKAIQELKDETGKEAFFVKLDLGDMKTVKAAAEEYLAKEDVLHILINNAGVMKCPIDWKTADGYDMQFGCNVLGHHYFTQLLLPALLIGTERTGVKSRVVTLSSAASYIGPGIDFETFVDGKKRRSQQSLNLYAQSKLGNIIDSRELSRRYGDKLVSISVNPGYITTTLYKNLNSVESVMFKLAFNFQPQHMGAVNELYAATAPECADKNGKFIVPWAREARPRKEALDLALGERLWDWLEAECAKYN